MLEPWMIVAIAICGVTLVSILFLLLDPWARLRVRPQQEALLSKFMPLRSSSADPAAFTQKVALFQQERQMVQDVAEQRERVD